MNKKFTPGPWRVRKIAEFDIYKNESLYVLANDDGIVKMGKCAKKVASMPNLHNYPDDVETIYANAYLIAAAPEMYDLLDRLPSDLKHYKQSKNDKMLDDITGRIESVLRKARGVK